MIRAGTLLISPLGKPCIIVAEGGRGMEMHINHIERFNKIQSYVRE